MLLASPEDFLPLITSHQRLLGLDVGEKTIGLALSDILCVVASPLETIWRKKFNSDMEHLQKVIKTHNIAGLIIGYPINMDGSEGPRCQSLRQFARNVEKIIPLPLVFWDERLSSCAANRMMLEADYSRAKRETMVDKLAASYILQGFLDRMNYLKRSNDA